MGGGGGGCSDGTSVRSPERFCCGCAGVLAPPVAAAGATVRGDPFCTTAAAAVDDDAVEAAVTVAGLTMFTAVLGLAGPPRRLRNRAGRTCVHQQQNEPRWCFDY